MIPFEPMLLGRSITPPLGDWTYEVKYDGYRVVVHTTARGTVVWSRNGYNLTPRFPEFVDLQKQIGPCVIDGELCLLDSDGRPRFEWMHRKDRRHATIVAFDVLRHVRRHTFNRPIEERRALLRQIISRDTALLLRAQSFTDGAALLSACEREQLEGIVAKRNGSTYEPGIRSDAWLKIRTAYGRAVIADRMAKW